MAERGRTFFSTNISTEKLHCLSRVLFIPTFKQLWPYSHTKNEGNMIKKRICFQDSDEQTDNCTDRKGQTKRLTTTTEFAFLTDFDFMYENRKHHNSTSTIGTITVYCYTVSESVRGMDDRFLQWTAHYSKLA